MGCDIHNIIEIEIDGCWFFIGNIVIYRDYYLFGILAGIRDDTVECITGGPKGLPDDRCDELFNLFENNYGEDIGNHSYSFLYLDELKKAKKAYGKDFPKHIIKSLEDVKKLPFVEDVRLVIWFDN